MTQTIDQTLAERGSRYGEFTDHAEITQAIKSAMVTGRNWNYLDDDMKECLEMVAHKIGRILNGDAGYIDSWTDIIGYTRLVEKRLIAETPKKAPVREPESPNEVKSILDLLREQSEAVKQVDQTEDDCDCPVCMLRRGIEEFVFASNKPEVAPPQPTDRHFTEKQIKDYCDKLNSGNA